MRHDFMNAFVVLNSNMKYLINRDREIGLSHDEIVEFEQNLKNAQIKWDLFKHEILSKSGHNG